MEITTKYNLEDTVYFMQDNKLKSAEIVGVNVSIRTGASRYIEYKVYRSNDIRELNINEEDLFTSKEELLKSL